MLNLKKNIELLISTQCILIFSMIPVFVAIPSDWNNFKILELTVNWQIPIVIILTILFSGEILIKSLTIYIFIGLFFLPVFNDGGSVGYLLTPNFGFILGMYPMIIYINKLNYKHKLSIYKFLFNGIISLLLLHLIGILYLTIQLILFNRIELILYSVGKYSLASLPFQILMLFPCSLLLIIFKKIKI
tara:strand:+ start:149 stop:712 length:564 start_codon:yes stop_codon:yes gene_type:complete